MTFSKFKTRKTKLGFSGFVPMLIVAIFATPILAKDWNPQNYKYYHDPEIATTKKAKDGRGSKVEEEY